MVDADGELDLSGKNIEIVGNPGARSGSALGASHYVPAPGKLFPADPSPNDIKQQGLADCYLLAGVIAILAQGGGPKTIAGLMKEKNGRVVVRLYDSGGNPRYVSVEKSIRKSAEKHNGGAIWATLLEKAYAAASFVEENKRAPGKTTGPALTGYAKLDFGKTEGAFKVLLGGDADRRAFDMGAFWQAQGNAGAIFRGMWALDETDRLSQHSIAAATDQVFGGDGNLWNAFVLWRTEYVKGQWETLLDAYGDIKDKKGETTRRKALRLEDLEAFFERYNMPLAASNRIMAFVEAKQLLPGKRGTGKYSSLQLRTFERIEAALITGKPVSVSTTKDVGKKSTGKGKTGGEALSKGLAGQHAYGVISVREDKDGLRWVRIRNPWGEMGREYIRTGNKLKAREISAGEFDLELNDLTKRFDSMSVSGVRIQEDLNQYL
jgi:hypothetical protein